MILGRAEDGNVDSSCRYCQTNQASVTRADQHPCGCRMKIKGLFLNFPPSAGHLSEYWVVPPIELLEVAKDLSRTTA